MCNFTLDTHGLNTPYFLSTFSFLLHVFMIDKIIALRKTLHQHPELSGNEKQTTERLSTFIETYNPTNIIKNIGGYGFVAIYEFDTKGPTIAIRCELDALPIEEVNNLPYNSVNKGISHKCGHDGHMAMVTGLIFWIKEQSFKTGRIVLLFQPAEETGKGAYAMLNDEKWQNIKPDYVFALHNLPKGPLHSIIVKSDSFSASVQSMIITLTGKKAHASEPENGINPSVAISEIIHQFEQQNNTDTKSTDFAIITPIYINLGEKSYGISPENAEIHYTIRTWNDERMKRLELQLQRISEHIAIANRLQLNIEWLEYFPATQNNDECVNIIKKVAKKQQLQLTEIETPMRFGEDFGWFSKNYKSAMFGLGAGENCKVLHDDAYDFPDEIIETGMNMFTGIITDILS